MFMIPANHSEKSIENAIHAVGTHVLPSTSIQMFVIPANHSEKSMEHAIHAVKIPMPISNVVHPLPISYMLLVVAE
jgi:hypothetical protein